MFNDAIIYNAIEKFHKIFTYENADQMARETSFIQRRSGKLIALNFLLLMIIKMVVDSGQALRSMTDSLAAMTADCRMTPQALAVRLNSAFAVRFLRRCYSVVLQDRLKVPMKKCIGKGILARFNDVFIEDSTSCTLHEKAKELFRGVGGSASKAGYKIHLLWDCLKSDICSMKLSGSSLTDQSTASNVIKFLTQGSLIIRDLGYFSSSIFAEIHEMGAFFLSRLKRGVCIYTLGGEIIEDLPSYIATRLGTSSTVELTVLLGKKVQLPVRLIAHRVPDDVYNQRMRKARQVARKQGYRVTNAAKRWNKYSIFITNAPVSKLSAEEVAVLYSMRWQIELIFKAWKSCLHIDIIRGQNKNRIQCFILGRLIAILLISSLFSLLSRCVYSAIGRDVSLYKFLTWIQKHAEILVSSKNLHWKMKLLESSLPDCYKQKRSRKTTLELLEQSSTYDDLYPYTPPLHPLKTLA